MPESLLLMVPKFSSVELRVCGNSHSERTALAHEVLTVALAIFDILSSRTSSGLQISGTNLHLCTSKLKKGNRTMGFHFIIFENFPEDAHCLWGGGHLCCRSDSCSFTTKRDTSDDMGDVVLGGMSAGLDFWIFSGVGDHGRQRLKGSH